MCVLVVCSLHLHLIAQYAPLYQLSSVFILPQESNSSRSLQLYLINKNYIQYILFGFKF